MTDEQANPSDIQGLERREGWAARVDRDERELHAVGLIEYYVHRDTGEPAYRHTEAALRFQRAHRLILTEPDFMRLLDAGDYTAAREWVQREAAKYPPIEGRTPKTESSGS